MYDLCGPFVRFVLGSTDHCQLELDKKLYHMQHVHRDIYNRSITHFDSMNSQSSLDESIDRSTTLMILQLKSGLDAKFAGLSSPPRPRSHHDMNADNGSVDDNRSTSIHAEWVNYVASLYQRSFCSTSQSGESSTRDVFDSLPTKRK